MAESRSKRPRSCKTYWSPDSSNNPSILDQIGKTEESKIKEATAAPTRNRKISAKTRAKKSSPSPTKMKLQFPDKSRQLPGSPIMGSCRSGPADSSGMDSKERLSGEESPPVLSVLGGAETNLMQIATVPIQLLDENEEQMPSLKFEGPLSPLIVTNEAGENLHKCVHESNGIEDTTMKLATHPAIESKKNPFLSEESSDGSVGCVEVNETEKKDEKESQVCQCACSSEELEEQHPPLASTPGSQQPPPLMPIIGDSANQDLCQESLLIDPKIESVEEVVITEVKEVVSLPSISAAPNIVGAADVGFNNISDEELHQAEKQCNEKIADILQQLEKIEANMKEMENRETSLQGTFKNAYAEFEANTDMFKGLQSAAAKLRVEISSKSEDVRKLLNDKKEAYARALKSEINYKELELMILKSLLDVTVRNPNTDTSDQQSMRARLKQEERMAALLNETASKKRTLEDLQYQHRAAEEEEHKLKEELRSVFVQLNQAKNNCDEAGKKTKKIQEEVDQVKKTLIQYQIDHESKSIELVDAKDSLLELETLVISRRRKELQMERNKLSASRRSTASSSDPQSAACQVQTGNQTTVSETSVVRRIRRLQSSVVEVVEHSSQQVESQSPPSSGQQEQIVIRTSYDLNVRTVQLFKP